MLGVKVVGDSGGVTEDEEFVGEEAGDACQGRGVGA